MKQLTLVYYAITGFGYLWLSRGRYGIDVAIMGSTFRSFSRKSTCVALTGHNIYAKEGPKLE